jgi:hypothetical protein
VRVRRRLSEAEVEESREREYAAWLLKNRSEAGEAQDVPPASASGGAPLPGVDAFDREAARRRWAREDRQRQAIGRLR